MCTIYVIFAVTQTSFKMCLHMAVMIFLSKFRHITPNYCHQHIPSSDWWSFCKSFASISFLRVNCYYFSKEYQQIKVLKRFVVNFEHFLQQSKKKICWTRPNTKQPQREHFSWFWMFITKNSCSSVFLPTQHSASTSALLFIRIFYCSSCVVEEISPNVIVRRNGSWDDRQVFRHRIFKWLYSKNIQFCWIVIEVMLLCRMKRMSDTEFLIRLFPHWYTKLLHWIW